MISVKYSRRFLKCAVKLEDIFELVRAATVHAMQALIVFIPLRVCIVHPQSLAI